MSLPSFLDVDFSFDEVLVTTTQEVIDAVISALTALGWTVTVGGTGVSPSTVQSPTRDDGLFFTVQMTIISATRLSYVVKDHNGLQVNNATDTRQDIGAGSTYVRIYGSPMYVIVDSGNVAGSECWAAGIMDRAPEPLASPRATYWATQGPRHYSMYNLTNASFQNVWFLSVGAAAYGAASTAVLPKIFQSTYVDAFTCAGTMLFLPFEIVDTGWLLGRAFNLLMTDQTRVEQTEFTVPLDDSTEGVFRVLGISVGLYTKLAARVA